MATKRRLIVAAGSGILAVPGIALAAVERAATTMRSARKISLKQVPPGALAGAAERLAAVSDAQLVKLKDGGTVYEL